MEQTNKSTWFLNIRNCVHWSFITPQRPHNPKTCLQPHLYLSLRPHMSGDLWFQNPYFRKRKARFAILKNSAFTSLVMVSCEKLTNRPSSLVVSVSASGSGGWGIKPQPSQIKDFKIVMGSCYLPVMVVLLLTESSNPVSLWPYAFHFIEVCRE